MDEPINEGLQYSAIADSIKSELYKAQIAESEARAKMYADITQAFTMIGDLKFATPEQGKISQQTYNESKDKTNRLTGGTANEALETLTDQVLSAIQLPVTSNKNAVTVVGIFCQVYFEDSSTGAFYNVTSVSRLGFVASQLENIDTNNVNLSFNPQAFFSPLNLRVKTTFSGSQRISVPFEINGGDIVRATGITPGLGDSVYFSITVQYISD